MSTIKSIGFLIITIMVFISCSSGNVEEPQNVVGDDSGTEFPGWLIPLDEVFDGGPGKDGIPSIDNPSFYNAFDAKVLEYLTDEDIVIGVKVDDEYRAYPHRIMDWHEIVNDEFGAKNKVTINYCPLTGTAFSWKFKNNNQGITFGVSGLLYNSNLILYDRATGSNWSQLSLKCVNGGLRGKVPDVTAVVEMKWKEWKKMYPDSKVLTNKQGFDRNYNQYPYGGYLNVDEFLFFPVTPINYLLPQKERVHAIIQNNKSLVFRFNLFENKNIIRVEFFNRNYLIIGDENTIVSFELSDGEKENAYTYSYSGGEEFFSDDKGNKWSVFGKAIDGPRKGSVLKSSTSVIGFWFSIAAFYPNPSIYN